MKPVFFFDVDGTLVDTKKNEVPKSSIEAISTLQEKGYLCCVATGRIFSNFKENIAYKAIDWDGYICGNGLQVVDKEGKYLANDAFSTELVTKVHEIVLKEGHSSCIICDDGIYMLDEMDNNAQDALSFLHEKVSYCAQYDNRIVRAMMIFAPAGYSYAPYNDIKEVKAIPSYVSYCDLILSSISKSKGIQVFLEHMGAKNYIAFGDSMNDYDMLEKATYSIAMGQAPEEIKSIVDYVSDPVDQDGLAQAIYTCVLERGGKNEGEE
ncbi:MAG: HAD family hydrolase [Bacillota bacterium]|nr:HAD family hydrolase [Bacillota bacterium]